MAYQCIERRGNLLIAARDSKIDLFNLEDGSYLSTWSCPWPENPKKTKSPIGDPAKVLVIEDPQSSSVDIIVDSNSPPAKRRKLSTGEDEKQETPTKLPEDNASESSKTQVQSGGKGGKQEKKQKQNNRAIAISTGLETPAIIALSVSKNDKYVVAVTGEDKCIRIFEILEAEIPSLIELSQR